MRNKRSFCLFSLLILFACSLFAQENWFYGKKIKKVTFEGLKTLTSTDLDSVTGQYIGKEFSDEVYADFLGSLFSLEYFDDISTSVLPYDTEKSACILQFTVIERPTIVGLKFTGNTKISATDLKEEIAIKKGDIFVSSNMED